MAVIVMTSNGSPCHTDGYERSVICSYPDPEHVTAGRSIVAVPTGNAFFSGALADGD